MPHMRIFRSPENPEKCPESPECPEKCPESPE